MLIGYECFDTPCRTRTRFSTSYGLMMYLRKHELMAYTCLDTALNNSEFFDLGLGGWAYGIYLSDRFRDVALHILLILYSPFG